MIPSLPIAQISPGVGALDGLLILLFISALFFIFLAGAIACGLQTWLLSKSGNPKKRRWLTATIVLLLLLLGLISGCIWVVTPKPLPRFEKRWDFTRSHSVESIGEKGDQDAYAYNGQIDTQILLPDQRSLSVQAHILNVKCEQGQIKEIEVMLPGERSVENVRRQGETILHALNFEPALIDQWRTGYPGFGWKQIRSSSVEPKIDMEGMYDEHLVDASLIIWISWEN